jgi:hypothetical protein
MNVVSNEQQILQLADSGAWIPNFQVWCLYKHYTFKNRFCESLGLTKTGLKDGVKVMRSMAFKVTIKQCMWF